MGEIVDFKTLLKKSIQKLKFSFFLINPFSSLAGNIIVK